MYWQGSGDGVAVIEAAKRGYMAHGVEVMAVAYGSRESYLA